LGEEPLKGAVDGREGFLVEGVAHAGDQIEAAIRGVAGLVDGVGVGGGDVAVLVAVDDGHRDGDAGNEFGGEGRRLPGGGDADVEVVFGNLAAESGAGQADGQGSRGRSGACARWPGR
jgi:hypothetical protein